MKKIILLSFLMINLFIRNHTENLKFVSFQELEKLLSRQDFENNDLNNKFNKEQIEIAYQFLQMCKQCNVSLFKSKDNKYYTINSLFDEVTSLKNLEMVVGLYLWYRIFYYIYYKIKNNFFTDNTKNDKNYNKN